MASQPETDAMRRALALAVNADLVLDANPRVGAVVLDPSGRVLGTGWHRGAGTPHAEVEALRGAGHHPAGTTVVVTLEPCDHVGRTGPCTEAIISAGVRRVVFAQADPSPLAAGGAAALRRAGLEVEGGLLAAEAQELNRHWTFAVRERRPFVTWKLATTLDGRSAAADGSSRWVTATEARVDTHRLRAECDTILAGTGTVEIDNPWLTVRTATGELLPKRRQPRRAVMGLRDLAADRRVFDDAAETVRLVTRDPLVALKELVELGSRHVWLEGGPTLAAGFVRAGVVDAVVAYVAPAFLGAGLSAVGDLGIATMSDALRLELVDVTRVGPDVRLTMTGPR